MTSEEQDVLDVALEDTGLDRGAGGDHLVGVDPAVRVLVGLALHQFLDGGHPGRATDHHDVVDVADGNAGVLDRLLEWALRPLQQLFGELLELGTGQLALEVEWAFGGSGDEGKVDLRFDDRRQLDLGFLGGFLEPLQGHAVLAEIDTVVVLEPFDQPVDDLLVPVVATEVGVTRGRLDLEDAIADLEDRDVEGPASEVEDQDRVVGVLVQPVRQRGRGRLVDDPQNVEPGDLACLLGGLALGVVEVGGHRDHGVGHLVPEVGLGVPLQLHQDAGRDLLGGVLLPVGVDGPIGPHVTLDRTDCLVGVGDRLSLGDLAHEYLTVFEGDNRGGGSSPFGVGDDCGLAAFEDGDHTVGGAEVDAYCACHFLGFLQLSLSVCADYNLSVPLSYSRSPQRTKRALG